MEPSHVRVYRSALYGQGTMGYAALPSDHLWQLLQNMMSQHAHSEQTPVPERAYMRRQ